MRLAHLPLLFLAACRQVGGVHDDVDVDETPGVFGGAGGQGAAGGSAGVAGTSVAGGAGGGASSGCPAALHGADLVWVDGVCIDRTEASAEQFAAFLSDGSYAAPVGLLPAGCTPNLVTRHVEGDPAGFPARGLTFCGAKAFCDWSGKRLCGKLGGGPGAPEDAGSPTSDEWSRGCMGGATPKSYPYGSGFNPKPQTCNDDEFKQPNVHCSDFDTCELQPVAAPTACVTAQGAAHMLGNVYEWTNLCEGPSPGLTCTIRGGSNTEYHSDVICQLARPLAAAEAHDDVGVRCCATPM